jgi:hypothetical protein
MKTKSCDACAHEGNRPREADIQVAFRPEANPSDTFYFCTRHLLTFQRNWFQHGGSREDFTLRKP